jgi:hypothetical protein
MEWAIPLQNLDIQNIQINTPVQGYKLVSALGYSDTDVNFNTLCILLPLLPVKSYEAASGRLQISLQGSMITNKLLAFQDLLIQTLLANQARWFPGEKVFSKDEIKQGFQPFVDKTSLHLYCPTSTTTSTNEIHSYSEKKWTNDIISPNLFTVGKQLRLAIKFQGLSFHQHPVTKMWTGKFRLQHRIVAVMTQ